MIVDLGDEVVPPLPDNFISVLHDQSHSSMSVDVMGAVLYGTAFSNHSIRSKQLTPIKEQT